MKTRKHVLLTLLFVCMVPFAIRGCAAMLFVVAPAPLVGQDNEPTASNAAKSDGQATPQAGVVAAARAKYERAEKSAREFARRLAKANQGTGQSRVSDADRAALRQDVDKAFAARQEQLRLELAEFQSRIKRLTQQLADRNEGREKIIDRRVDELLTPNLRWDEPSAAPAAVAESNPNHKPGTEPDNSPAVENDSPTALRKVIAFVDELQGTWLAVNQGSNGELRPFKGRFFTLTFRDNRYEFREGAAPAYSSGDITVKRAQDAGPASLDLTRTHLQMAGDPALFAGPAQPRIEHAIVRIEGDTLTMCWGGIRSNDRPDEFTTAKEDGRLLMVYRRISSRPLTTDELKTLDIGDLKEQTPASRTEEKPNEEKPLAPIEEALPQNNSAAADIHKLLGLELRAVKQDSVGKEPFKGGLQVVSIVENGPAAKAGLRVNDIVVGAHVWEVLSMEQLQFALDRNNVDRPAFESSAFEPSDGLLTLHVVRSRETVRELFRASLALPFPSASPSNVTPSEKASTPLTPGLPPDTPKPDKKGTKG